MRGGNLGGVMLVRGQPLKQFVVGVVNVLNYSGLSWTCTPGVDVLEAGQCCPGDVLGAQAHSVKGFPILRAAIALPGTDASREHRPYCGSVEGFLQCTDKLPHVMSLESASVGAEDYKSGGVDLERSEVTRPP